MVFIVDNGYVQLPGINWFDKRSKLSPYEAGVRTLCYTPGGEPIVDGDRVQGVLADTKRGRRALLARFVVDAPATGTWRPRPACRSSSGGPPTAASRA